MKVKDGNKNIKQLICPNGIINKLAKTTRYRLDRYLQSKQNYIKNMVQLSKFLFERTIKKIRRHLRGNLMDSLRLTVKGGHGGNGLPRYGGIGGQGGCVYFVAKEKCALKNIAQKYQEKKIIAASGEDSSKVRIVGRRGVDQRIEVPVGVQVLDDTGKIVSDLNEENSTHIAAGGGMGGCAGTNFLGKAGEHRVVRLDLKLIADVGLVGFPNAGKSTLLKAISKAKPKIASYPFTTIRPQIGTIHYSDLRSITIADLPGLIEGAHANFGMGHKFLKHIERTRLLLLIVDIFGFKLSVQHAQRNCLENIYALNKELELYDSSLLDKPCVLLVNKMDGDGASQLFNKFKPAIENLERGLEQCPENIRPTTLLNFERVIPISAKNSARVNYVKQELRSVLDNVAEKDQVTKPEIVQEILQRKIGEHGPRIT